MTRDDLQDTCAQPFERFDVTMSESDLDLI